MVKDAIDLAAAVFHSSPNVRAWPATLRITAIDETPAGGFAFEFDRAIPESWKWPSNPDVPSDNFQWTVWAFLNIGGTWHGGGFVQMWQGRAMGGRARSLPPLFQDVDGAPGWTRWWGDVRRLWGEMSTVQPKSGDVIGFMVTAGNGRLTDGVTSVAERSNVVTFRIVDTDDTGMIYAPDGPLDPPVVPPVDPPPVPSGDLANVLAALANMEKRQTARHQELMATLQRLIPAVYDGTFAIPYLGKATALLIPRPPKP